MVALGRALMARPRLLLLDEPPLGPAPLVVREIARAILARRVSEAAGGPALGQTLGRGLGELFGNRADQALVAYAG